MGEVVENKKDFERKEKSKETSSVISPEDELGNICGEMKEENQYRNWFFTYNNYKTEKDKEGKDDIDLMEDVLSTISYEYVFQEEIGEKKGTPHLQGTFKLKNKKGNRWTEVLKAFSHISNTICLRKCRSFKKCVAYCSKLKTRKEGTHPYTNIDWLPEEEEPIRIICSDWLYYWQLEIIDIIKNETLKCNDRIIHWYWENVGNVGKSCFCKYLCVMYQALILSGSAKDMKHGIVSYMNKHHKYPKIVILDIPRSCENYISWTGIEEIKNACFFSPKYESDMVIGNCPILICFANFEPDENKLSIDRWNINKIMSEYDIVRKSFDFMLPNE